MKLLKLFLLLGAPVFIFSCSEDEPSFDESLIIGDWAVTAIDYSGTATASFAGISTTESFTGTTVELDMIVQFTEEPKNMLSSGSYTIDLVTEALGQTSSELVELSQFLMPGTWKIEGNKLTIEAAGVEPQTATIKKLTSSVLVIAGKFEETLSELGVTVTEKVNIVYTFEKIE